MGEILQYPSQLKTKPLQGFMVFREFIRDGRSATNPGKSIYLYMPERLENPNTVGWDTEKLGSFYGVLNDSVRNSGNLDPGAAGWQMLASSAAMMAPGAISKLMNAVGGGNLSQNTVTGGVMGMVTNPYVVKVFRGVDLRTFQFSFKLYPHNQQERDEIHEIIKAFRGAALPEGSTETATPAWLNYPNEFEIEYWMTDKNGKPVLNEWLNKFKRSVITGIDTDYTASGQFSITRDGFPTEINLSIRFSELEIILRDDVQKYGY